MRVAWVSAIAFSCVSWAPVAATAGPTAPVTWGNQSSRKNHGVKWGNAAGTAKMPRHVNGLIVFAPGNAPYAMVGRQVYNLETQQPVGRRLRKPVPAPMTVAALSSNGHWFAACSKTQNLSDAAIAIWSTTTGRLVCTILGVKHRYVDAMAIVGHKLLEGGRSQKHIRMYDVRTGKLVCKAAGSTRFLNHLAVAPGSHVMAALGHGQRLAVYSTINGERLALMGFPAVRGLLPGAPRANYAQYRRDFAFQTFTWIRAWAFAPDGKSLAVFSSLPVPEFLQWDHTGRVIAQRQLHYSFIKYLGSPIAWLPDSSGYLFANNLYIRGTPRAVLRLAGYWPQWSVAAAKFLTRRRMVLVTGPAGDQKILYYNVPWTRISASLAAFRSGAGPALLRAGMHVRVEWRGLHGGNAPALIAMLQKALRARLQRARLIPAASGPLTLMAKWTEGKIKLVKEAVNMAPFEPGPVIVIPETYEKQPGFLHLRLLSGKNKQVIFTRTYSAASSMLPGAATPEAMQKSMAGIIASEMQTLDFPWFVPQQKSLSALPILASFSRLHRQ